MRSLLLSLICVLCLNGPALADIERPATLNDTLSLLLERLKPASPEARLNPADRNITLDRAGATIVNPDNIHAVLQSSRDGAEREAALENFVDAMTDAMNEPARDPADLPLDRVFPVLRHASFAQSTGDGGVAPSAGNGLYYEPYIGDMILVYAIDYPDRVAYVTRANLRDADVYPSQMNDAAWRNFAAKRAALEFQGNGTTFMAVIDGFYESTLVLDSELWASVAQQMNDDIVMIVPARDLIIVAPASNTAEVAFLSTMRTDVINTGTHQLSELMYIWQGGRWDVFTQ